LGGLGGWTGPAIGRACCHFLDDLSRPAPKAWPVTRPFRFGLYRRVRVGSRARSPLCLCGAVTITPNKPVLLLSKPC
jgi:hypothetical protein